MMGVKRKHGDIGSEDGKPKNLKQNNKGSRKPKRPKTERDTSPACGQKQNGAQKNITKFSKEPKVSADFVKSEMKDTMKSDKQIGSKAEGKPKVWKRWEKMKKHKKNKALLKKDPDTSKFQPRQGDNPLLKKKDDNPKKTDKPELVSCNWKKLKMDIKDTRKKKYPKKKDFKKKHETKTEKKQEASDEPDIWFDDVDEELLKPMTASQNNTKTKPVNKSATKKTGEGDGLVKEHSFKGLTKAVALDCEMVGVGDAGKESVLARVSVVNQYGECLYDTFVRSREEIVDYRTRWSGVTPESLENATDFLDAQKTVSDLLRGRILVGHAVHHDLKVLFLDHPRKDIRDTSSYKPYRQLFKGRTPSLKNLTSRLLNVKIQTGEHNSVTDAQAAMRLYTFSRQEWEKHRRKKRTHKTKSLQKKKTKED